MMAENNDIFPAGGDALVYLAVPMHKKYSTTCVWGHPFSTQVCQDRFFNPPHPCNHMFAFRVTFSAVGLFQKILLSTIAHVLNNMTQMLQKNKNSSIKYNKIQVKFN